MEEEKTSIWEVIFVTMVISFIFGTIGYNAYLEYTTFDDKVEVCKNNGYETIHIDTKLLGFKCMRYITYEDGSEGKIISEGRYYLKDE